MSWLGINVLPKEEINAKETEIDISDRPVGTFLVNDDVQACIFILLYSFTYY